MPQHKSVEKRLRQSKKHNIANRYVRSTMRTAEKKLRNINNQDQIENKLNNYFSIIDKAVKRNIIKKNTANRKKSRIQKYLNNL